MGHYKIPEYSKTVTQNYIILDSNVIIAAFDPNDKYHEQAKPFLDDGVDGDEEFIISMSVLVESWGMLVGRGGNRRNGIEMLNWVNTPGNAHAFPQDSSPLADYVNMITQVDNIDSVDIFLAHLSNDISSKAKIDEKILIATFDTKDFVICREKYNLGLRILDMRSYDVY